LIVLQINITFHQSLQLAQMYDDIRRYESRIARLDDVQAQRRMALERIDRDAIRAADWVKKNQHRLKRKVWGPVALEVLLHHVNTVHQSVDLGIFHIFH
jgi:hypothetical protein